MPRWFRWYEKKRGRRRTGSQKLASAGEALFFAMFLAIGSAVLALMLVKVVVREWRVNHDYVETAATVLDKKLELQSEGGSDFRPAVLVRYEVDGRPREAWANDATGDYANQREEAQAVLDYFDVGRQYLAWYDPANPDVVVLLRGFTWWLWLLLLVPLSFIVIGGGGLVYTLLHWGKSVEHRAAVNQRVADLDIFEEASEAAGTKRYPNVPRAENLTNSPGTTLAYRLPMTANSSWRLFGAAAACISWNAVVLILIVLVLVGQVDAHPAFIVFLVAAGLVGVALGYYFARQMLVTTGIGPTLVEISDHPLLPGGKYEILLIQSGNLRLNTLTAQLVCDELVTYRQGTDTRSDSSRVHQQQVWQREDFSVEPGRPFEVRLPLVMPEGAMHSFISNHNEVQWKLIVTGDLAGWPSFERSFPLVVYPRTSKTAAA